MVFVWILLYGLVLSGANSLPMPGMKCLMLAGYALAFLCWIWKTGRQKQVYLAFPVCRNKKDGWQLLPLLLFPMHNLIFTMAGFPAGAVWLEMLSVCLVEELFFRGFLLGWLGKKGPFCGILGTSLVFSLLHLGNLFSAGDMAYVFLQVIGSFFVSICYCAVTILWGNLLPCVAAHFLTNIFGAGELVFVPALMCCIGLHVLWGGLLCLQIKKEKRNAILH